MIKYLLLPLLPILLCTCGSAPDNETIGQDVVTDVEEAIGFRIYEAENPPAPNFDLAGSDAEAIRIVDSLVKYHGGRETYDNTRYFTWNFFGARTLHWDKLDERVRIESAKDSTVYLVNYGEEPLTGKMSVNGVAVTDPEQLAEGLARAKSMFINDSYWLVQQFKLLDDGVTLKLLPEVAADSSANRPSYVIDQTFAGVGDTPQNRYRLYVDQETYAINHWAFYRDTADEEPAMQTPWQGYEPRGGLMLSGDRGGRFQLSGIDVPRRMDDEIFTEL
ncbi:hypothetical protein [Neolewinella antarctica]|uniref:Lipoprotein n=1 Tax=Neolewinella antarctica TaxID=442734 RepID=A0ABX0X925_9BACT|nr:hypothetical protein [Neolewinella antarctica]NJC25323.1 hypothetical protein [Neolewinella antarctica]